MAFLGSSGMLSRSLAFTSVSWPCSVLPRGVSSGLSEVPWGGRLSWSPSAAIPGLWSSKDTLSETRRLGGAVGRFFFVGSGGGEACCKGLEAAPGFIASSLRGPRPAVGHGSLSQAVIGGWLGWSGGPGAWGVTGAGTGGEVGKGQAGAGAEAGSRGGWAGLEGCRGSTGGGGGGRRGAHLEVGEVVSEVGGKGRAGQLPRGGWSVGRALLQSSMKIGFTNHRRSFPTDSSISQAQFASWAVGLRLETCGNPGAWSLGGSAGFPLSCGGFSEESQKPRPRLAMVSRSVKLLASRMAWGSRSVKGSKSLLTQ